MNLKASSLILAVALVGVCAVPAVAESQSFMRSLLRFLGVSASPNSGGAVKGPEDRLEVGDLWIAGLEPHQIARLTSAGGFQWPVFSPGDNSVLALRGEEIVDVPITGAPVTVLQQRGEIQKLVGFEKSDPDKLLVLTQRAGKPPGVGVLSLATGRIKAIAHSPSKDQRLLRYLLGNERDYGATKLYLGTESKPTVVGGQRQWLDVYVVRGGERPRNISQCDGSYCMQPSLSMDGSKVVFIKMEH